MIFHCKYCSQNLRVSNILLIFVAEIKDVNMIVEMFFIYIMIVLVAVVIKAVSKVGHGSSSNITFDDVKEQIRKNREETAELKAKIKAAGLDTLLPKKAK